MEKDVREHTEEKAGCQGAGEGTEDWKEKEKQQYLGGLRRLSEKGIAIYMDGRVSGPPDWAEGGTVRQGVSQPGGSEKARGVKILKEGKGGMGRKGRSLRGRKMLFCRI